MMSFELVLRRKTPASGEQSSGRYTGGPLAGPVLLIIGKV
jgi:hypothetical protein